MSTQIVQETSTHSTPRQGALVYAPSEPPAETLWNLVSMDGSEDEQ